MPKYKCHKEVWALKIRQVDLGGNGEAVLHWEEPGYMSKPVNRAYVTKHQPQAGGYYVVYKDGYESWSPAEAFEDGYTRIDG